VYDYIHVMKASVALFSRDDIDFDDNTHVYNIFSHIFINTYVEYVSLSIQAEKNVF
jgi:hypothetical protein